MSDKIKSRAELRSAVEKARSVGKSIVTTNGCFDILHLGHIRYLKRAKQQGDVLIVAINSDSSVRSIKGERRPINHQRERAEMLAALECVDYVVIFSEPDPIQLLSELRPDIHVKGGDYRLDQIIEREAVESFGGEVRVMPGVEGRSTSQLIEKILETYGKSRSEDHSSC